VIAAEEATYRASQNDAGKLRELARSCEACLLKEQALTRADQIDGERQAAVERERLTRLPCQAERLTTWLRQHGAYNNEAGNQPLDTSIYEDEVDWTSLGARTKKTRQVIEKEENADRIRYRVQKYFPTTLSAVAVGDRCLLTQQWGSYKERTNGKLETPTYKITFVIRVDANGPRSIVGQQIDVLSR
jgi:hypothetical protein